MGWKGAPGLRGLSGPLKLSSEHVAPRGQATFRAVASSQATRPRPTRVCGRLVKTGRQGGSDSAAEQGGLFASPSA
eukprot:8318863-Alexandrium_andersonii.AAC.1